MIAKAATVGLPLFQTLAREARIERSVSLALVGYGRRGEELLEALTHVPGARVAAVADIWPWRRELAQDRMRSLHLPLRVYETLDELLDAEGDRVDAVIMATPDWQHANHVSACLKAGKHVYCEGELADSVAKARELVRLARETGRLVQGGHQRRSNPRYIHAFETVGQKAKALGRVTHAYAQWHRAAASFYTVPQRFAIPTQVLETNGYENMARFLNWEWFRRYSPGPTASLAGQKLDLLRWFWRAEPVSVSAVGGNDCCGRENEDALMALFTFINSERETVRAYVQVLNTARLGGSFEQFIGENAVLTMSENAARGNSVQPEFSLLQDLKARAVKWTPHVRSGNILPLKDPPDLNDDKCACAYVDARASKNAPGWPLPVTLDKPVVQSHLENLVAAIRGEAVLNDPVERAYANLVGVEGALRSAALRCPVDFAPQDFTA